MTLGMMWIRKVGKTTELVAASDSRLNGGQKWDGCPKLLLLPRSDAVFCFAGDTYDAYPLMIQVQNSIAMFPKTKDRTTDLLVLKGHLMRVLDHMRGQIHGLPRNQATTDNADATFLFGGYSWRKKDFRFWMLRDTSSGFVQAAPNNWGRFGGHMRIHFIGDREAVGKAKRKLGELMVARGKMPDGEFDMEPFEVLRDIIRSGEFHSVGGPPQLAKVYEHMNTLPFAIYWPDRKSGNVAAMGRPLLPYEVPDWPVLDPDDIQFNHFVEDLEV